MQIFAHWQRLIVFVLHYLPERHCECNSHVCGEALQRSKKRVCVRSNNTAELMCENRAAVKVWIIIWGEGNENIQGSKRKGIALMFCFSVSWFSNLWSAAMTVTRGQQYPICFVHKNTVSWGPDGIYKHCRGPDAFLFQMVQLFQAMMANKKTNCKRCKSSHMPQSVDKRADSSEWRNTQTESEENCHIHIYFVLSCCSQWVKAAAELYIISYAGGMIHKHISSLMRRLWKLLMSALRAFCGHHQESHVEVHEGALYLNSTHR